MWLSVLFGSKISSHRLCPEKLHFLFQWVCPFSRGIYFEPHQTQRRFIFSRRTFHLSWNVETIHENSPLFPVLLWNWLSYLASVFKNFERWRNNHWYWIKKKTDITFTSGCGICLKCDLWSFEILFYSLSTPGSNLKWKYIFLIPFFFFASKYYMNIILKITMIFPDKSTIYNV